jgi:hypothetical protein
MNSKQLDRYLRRCQKSLDEIDDEAPYEWKVLVALSFGYFRGLSRSRRLFYRWLSEIRKPVFPAFLNWFAVIEFDCRNNGIRIYALIGGSQISFQPRWKARWQNLSAGDAVISDYRPGALAEHVLKNADDGRYFEIAMDLCGWGLFEINRG